MDTEYQTTNAELAVLTLAAEGPRYGYQIDQIVAARGMRQWTEIGFSSIYYLLKKLERAGLLESETRGSGSRPARRVYSLTPPGLALLRQEIRARLAAPRLHSGDLDLALAGLALLPIPEVRACLDRQLAALQTRLVEVRSKWETDRRQPHYPWHVDELFSHTTALIEAEVGWLEGCIARLEKKPQTQGDPHA